MLNVYRRYARLPWAVESIHVHTLGSHSVEFKSSPQGESSTLFGLTFQQFAWHC